MANNKFIQRDPKKPGKLREQENAAPHFDEAKPEDELSIDELKKYKKMKTGDKLSRLRKQGAPKSSMSDMD